MKDFSHLDAIQHRLFRAQQRLAQATAKDREWYQHEVWMIEREEAAEYQFLGIVPQSIEEIMNDTDLLANLLE